jgi:hypothetical protein
LLTKNFLTAAVEAQMKTEFSRISIFGSNEEEKNLKLSKLPKKRSFRKY